MRKLEREFLEELINWCRHDECYNECNQYIYCGKSNQMCIIFRMKLLKELFNWGKRNECYKCSKNVCRNSYKVCMKFRIKLFIEVSRCLLTDLFKKN